MENNNNKIISCSGVPAELLDKINAKLHFRKYGRIIRICLRPKSRSCSIQYDNEESAQNALLSAGEYNGQIFTVGWETQRTPGKKKSVKKIVDPDWNMDPDIQAELAAMSGDTNIVQEYNLRGNTVDSLVPKMLYMKKTRKVEPKVKKVIKKSMTQSSDISNKALAADQLEILTILKQAAHSLEDKYKVLEARDKLIRLRTKKYIDLTRGHTVGTCPDMCPERERLMREIQHQTHFYEQETNGRGMNHALAVKQYSRSSADQEVPLPHELRPVGTLQLTMGYLMHNIMNLCDSSDVNLSEWFHFLWDRTRGIRKDITQQELCCEGSVELVEQCARFHIHCSARLVAEDPSTFDQKINTENLTKCLQTLKYMYNDLKIKGVYCRNEPEFRAYIILLNLNDGNFMWEVQQLQCEITKSFEVKFALEIYSALDKNNYVKFFKLVKTTTYLNACILLRYFIQVRLRAITTILKSFSPRTSNTMYPVQELTNILGFEDYYSTIEFLKYYGLYLNQEDTHVVLDKKFFSLPELPFSPRRAINIIEVKKLFSVGEVVCGKSLPPPYYKNHIPHNSFDDDGFLNLSEYSNDLEPSKIEALDVDTKTDIVKSTDEVVNELIEVGTLKTFDIFQKSKCSAMNAFNSVKNIGIQDDTSEAIPEESITEKLEIITTKENSATKPFSFAAVHTSTASKNYGGFKFDLPATRTITDMFSNSVSSVPVNVSNQNINFGKPFASSVFSKTESQAINASSSIFWPEKPKELPESNNATLIFEEEARLEEQRRKEEEIRKKQEERKRLEQLKQLEEQQRQEKKKLDAILQQKEEQRKLKAKLEKQRLIEERKRYLEEEHKRSFEAQKAIKEVVDNLITEVEEKIKSDRLEEISSMIKKRKLKALIKKWKDRVKKNTRKRKLVEDCPLWIYNKTTEEEARELFSKTQELTLQNMKRYKKGTSLDFKIPQEKPLEKINLYHLTFKALLQKASELSTRVHNKIFWKIDLSLPDNFELKIGFSCLTKSIEALFDWKTKNNKAFVIEEYRNAYNRIVYCIEKQKGIQNVENSNGLLYITKDFNEVFLKRVKESLKKINSKTRVPIFIIVDQIDETKLQLLTRNKTISNYKVVMSPLRGQKLTICIEKGLQFLASSLEKPPPLELDVLKSFFLKHLATEPWKRVASFAKWNQAYKCCLMKPRIVIELYNEALEHLKAIILDETLSNYQSFPDIFDDCLDSKIPDFLPCDYKYFPKFWNMISYKALLEKIVNSLKLPSYTTKWPANEYELEGIVLDYCSKVYTNPEVNFYKIMSRILRHVDPNTEFAKVKEILWTDIIETIAIEKINDTDFLLKNTPFISDCIFNECFVVYNQDKLHEYTTKPWFYLENPLIQEEINMTKLFREPATKKGKHVTEEVCDLNIDEVLQEIQNNSVDEESLNKSKTEMKNIQYLLADLEESMAMSKKISKTFEKTLKQVLDN